MAIDAHHGCAHQGVTVQGSEHSRGFATQGPKKVLARIVPRSRESNALPQNCGVLDEGLIEFFNSHPLMLEGSFPARTGVF